MVVYTAKRLWLLLSIPNLLTSQNCTLPANRASALSISLDGYMGLKGPQEAASLGDSCQ